MPTEARGRPKQPSSLRTYSGAAGTLGNHRETATPEGTSAACSCWLLPSRKGAQSYKTLFLFSSREAKDRFFVVVVVICFLNRKCLDLWNILSAKHNSLAGHSLQLLVSSIINTLVITASDVY